MNKILCSTGSLMGKANNRNYWLLEEYAQKLMCDGFEFMMYSYWYDSVDKLVAGLQQMPINIPVMHCEKRICEAISRNEDGDLAQALQLFTVNCEVAAAINASKIVLHLWNGIISDKYIQNNIHAFGALKEIADKNKLDLMIENVVCGNEDPMKHWSTLAKQYPQISFVFDTKMAAFHNQMDLIYSSEYEWLWNNGNIMHLHINDYAGGHKEWERLQTLPIGQGNINFHRFFKFLGQRNYKGFYTVEAPALNSDGKIDFDMLNSCFKNIRENGIAHI